MSGIPQPHGGALVNGHSKMDVAGMEEIKVSASIQRRLDWTFWLFIIRKCCSLCKLKIFGCIAQSLHAFA